MKLKMAMAACLAAALVSCSQRGGSASNGADRTPDEQRNPTAAAAILQLRGRAIRMRAAARPEPVLQPAIPGVDIGRGDSC